MFSNRTSITRGCFLAAGVLAMAGMALASSTASAAVIYQGNFTGTEGMGSLNGTSVTVGPNASNYVSGSLSSTWLATSSSSYGWSDSGYFNDSANNPGRATAQLNFTPLSGDIYTLSATVSLTNGANTAAYLSIGFLSNANSSNLTAGWDNGNVTSGDVSASPWVLVTWENDAGTYFTGPGTKNAAGFSTGQSGALTNDNFEIVLNTTGADTSNSPWTYQIYNNNTLVSGSNPIDLPAGTVINEVGMQAASATGTVSSFELATVPEPATLGLVAVGGLGLLLLKRRKAV
ncbi:MAG: PEP-CTERM sorting domain-containing protein [Planctomycetia bacterium]|nr:PEP-CTERM sorting domain-containing protein [Planctomycetia bacterium]